MYAGRPVEVASVEELYRDRRMPYTAGLLGSVPRLDAPQGARLVPIPGAPPSMAALPPGCPFAPRCPLAVDDCRVAEPDLLEMGPNHRAACIRTRRGRRPQRGADLRRVHRTARRTTRRRCAGGAARTGPGQDVQADQGCGFPQAGRRGACGRRHQLRSAAGPHAGHRRRIRVGQVDDVAPGARADGPSIGFYRGARHRRRDADRPDPPGAARRSAGGVPGPGGVAGSSTPGVRSIGRAVERQRFREESHRRTG